MPLESSQNLPSSSASFSRNQPNLENIRDLIFNTLVLEILRDETSIDRESLISLFSDAISENLLATVLAIYDRDFQKAVSQCRIEAASGDKLACYLLVTLISYEQTKAKESDFECLGVSMPQDSQNNVKSTVLLSRELVRLGHLPSVPVLGYMIYKEMIKASELDFSCAGLSIPPGDRYEQAATLFRHAAGLGNKLSVANLAYMILRGKIQARETDFSCIGLSMPPGNRCEQAAALYRHMRELDDTRSITWLAYLISYGDIQASNSDFYYVGLEPNTANRYLLAILLYFKAGFKYHSIVGQNNFITLFSVLNREEKLTCIASIIPDLISCCTKKAPPILLEFLVQEKDILRQYLLSEEGREKYSDQKELLIDNLNALGWIINHTRPIIGKGKVVDPNQTSSSKEIIKTYGIAYARSAGSVLPNSIFSAARRDGLIQRKGTPYIGNGEL